MTTATADVTTTPVASRSGFGQVMLSEWTKLKSVRSTGWSLALLAVLYPAFTALFVGLTVASWDQMTESDRALAASDPAAVILGSGFLISQPAICVLGVMAIASEYSTGMIRASLLAVPRRMPLLAAKAVVLCLLVLAVSLVAAFASFFVGASMLASKVDVSLGDPGVARAVVGTALYLAVLSLFAFAIGAIVRRTAAGITSVIMFVLVLAPLVQLLPGKVGEYAHAYLPTEAGILIGQATKLPGDLLTPWQGFGVFCLWTAALLALAAVLLKRRDA
ncbi:ABC transporter permease subunit [Micromonospora sp. WMMA1949]|uniref:ABC transporter n=1 Tax=Micromonospora echinospora TaxID=1877 RepID=A0A2C9DJN9_MICEC|nr:MULTISPECIES: ABC transporter permease subunit [unclassified Micromonospora]ARD70851.1 ABC transporter [Micromonospora echinospora]MCZ7428680.1 ABC transporter permease subunit [Micromonospora sp. WMMA1949]WBC07551.1 ABC transporter permease subunit [Micromonospora sp. WMMA1947]